MTLVRSAAELSRRSYDFIVVGAGSGGCAAAGTLARRILAKHGPSGGPRVLLLEAGPPTDSMFISCPALTGGAVGQYPIAKKFNWNLESVPQPGLLNRRAYLPRGCGLGGSSSINAMIYIRGHRLDYDRWGKAFAGWTYEEDVLPAFIQMESNTRGAGPYHGDGGVLRVSDPDDICLGLPFNQAFLAACSASRGDDGGGGGLGLPRNNDFNAETTFGCGPYQHTIRDGRRDSAYEAHVRPLVNDTRRRYRDILHVATNSAALRLTYGGQATPRVTGVDVVHRDATSGKCDPSTLVSLVATAEVVVALGAIHTPPLLMRSGIGDVDSLKRQIANSGTSQTCPPPSSWHQLSGVGDALQDHLDLKVVWRARRNRGVHSKANNPGNLRFLASQARKYFCPAAGDRPRGTFSSVVEMGAFLHRGDAAMTAAEHHAAPPEVQLHFLALPLLDHLRTIALYQGCALHVCNLYPKSRGTVRLPVADPMSLEASPVVDFGYLTHPDDVVAMHRDFDIGMQVMSHKSFAEYDPEFIHPPEGAVGSSAQQHPRCDETTARRAQRDEFARRYADTVYHPMGSCAMGAVVDERLRLLAGPTNVRIADASVIPFGLGGNTNAPCQMIGKRCADFVALDHSI